MIDLEDVKSGSSYWQQLFSQLCDPESTDEANAGDDHADAFNESTFLPPISPMDKPLTLAVDTEAPLTESASSSSLTLTLEPSHALLKSAEDSPKTELQTNVQVIREINDSCTIKAAIEDNTVVIHSAELSSETIAMSTTVSAPMAVKSAWVGMVDLVVNLCLCNRGQETASSTVTTNVNKSATMTTANTDALSSSTMSPRIPEADDEVTL